MNDDRLTERSRIADAFIARCGDPSKWEYRGEVIEVKMPGKCVCGHAIKMLFPIYAPNGADRVDIGSTCIDHYAAYSPANADSMRAALAAFLEKKKEQERQAKARLLEADVAAKTAEYLAEREKVLGQAEHNCAAGHRISYYIYTSFSNYPKTVEYVSRRYKSKRGLLGWLNTKLKGLRELPERAQRYDEESRKTRGYSL